MEHEFELPMSCLKLTGTSYGRRAYYAICDELLKWLNDNCKSTEYTFKKSNPWREIMVNRFESTYVEMDLITFKNKDSATLFKLTWS